MRKIILAVLAILLALAGAAYCADTALTNTSINFTYPVENAVVATNEVIEGTSHDIPDGYRLWIVVYPFLVNRYYFQDFSPNFMPNGDWSNSAVIGDDHSSGQRFYIYVVLADSKANESIEEHLADCRINRSWPGLEKLPEGTSIMNRMRVRRS